MTWTADPKNREAINEYGYKVTWAKLKGSLWFNGFTPNGKHVAGGYDRVKIEAECDLHRQMLALQRGTTAARRASREVA
jgi:hypothetical protein